MEFLGFIVGIKGLRAIESMIQAIIGWPIPKTMGKVRSFYGLVISYRRFIHIFNTKAAPITECLKKESSNKGKSKRRVFFFFLLKGKLYTTLVVTVSNFNKLFKVECNASSKGIRTIF